MLDNPNEYNAEAYTQASNETYVAVQALWSAGASAEDVRQIVDAALEDCEDQR